jgi:glucose-6-phosphate 1-dehydrogenase
MAFLASLYVLYRTLTCNQLANLGRQVEKPFGKDLGSSRELQRALGPDWTEDEIFRIDHYLGKEMVKNILILRFGNEFFGATWNRNHIDNVQVS